MTETDPIYRQAVTLLLAIHTNNWPGAGITPGQTTSAVLTQIDHLTAYMKRVNTNAPPPVPPFIMRGAVTPDAIQRQIEGEPLTRPTAVSLVNQWARDWMFADGPHWGDKISWRCAAIIAQKIDEAYTGA